MAVCRSNPPLLMIPGPHEVDKRVLNELSLRPTSHMDPSFAAAFRSCLKNYNALIGGNTSTQPFIISGGGSIGYDAIAASLCEPELNDQILILNNGIFSDKFDQCCQAYNLSTHQIKARSIGDVVTPQQLQSYLTDPSHRDVVHKLKLIFIVHVDTSTGVRCDVQSLSAVARKYAPHAFVAVDGICSFAAEEFKFSAWNIDAAITATQKAFGCPPGLCMIALSERVVNYMCNLRKYPVHSFYVNLVNWLPVMRAYQSGKAAYFSTPNINLIRALDVSCRLLMDEGIENVVERHRVSANAFRASLKAIGLEFVPVRDEICASTLSAVKFPKEVDGQKLLKIVNTESEVVLATGIHPQIKGTYFRVGHMGISTKMRENENVLKCVQAIEYALEKCGYQFQKGRAVSTFYKHCSLKAKL